MNTKTIKTNKKLSLQKESLRSLATDELHQAAGGCTFGCTWTCTCTTLEPCKSLPKGL
jgi:hypothetical protein